MICLGQVSLVFRLILFEATVPVGFLVLSDTVRYAEVASAILSMNLPTHDCLPIEDNDKPGWGMLERSLSLTNRRIASYCDPCCV